MYYDNHITIMAEKIPSWNCTKKQLESAQWDILKDLSDKALELGEKIHFAKSLGFPVEHLSIEKGFLIHVVTPTIEKVVQDLHILLNREDLNWKYAIADWSKFRDYKHIIMNFIKSLNLDYVYDCDRDILILRPIIKDKLITRYIKE